MIIIDVEWYLLSLLIENWTAQKSWNWDSGLFFPKWPTDESGQGADYMRIAFGFPPIR